MRECIINFMSACLLATPLYLIIRKPWRRKDNREIFVGLFAVYLAGLLAVTLRGTYRVPSAAIADAIYRIKHLSGINVVPIRYIIAYFKYADADTFLINFVSNIVIFIPWGFGLMLLWQKNHKPLRIISLLLGLTVFIEFFQLFISRNTDIDDIILNFAGGFVGVIIYFLITKINPKIKNLAK